MGKGPSKHWTLQHLQEQQVTGGAKNVDENKQANISTTMNEYSQYPGQNYPKTGNERDPSKTGERESTPPKKVEDESKFKEDAQIQTKPDYEIILYQVHGSGSTDQYENLSVQDGGTESLHSTTYENIGFCQDYCGAHGSSVFPGHLDAEAEMSIRRCYRELKRRISVKDVCDHLIQNGVLAPEDYEDIGFNKQLRSADTLLQILMRKKQLAYGVFLNALQCTGFQDLADKLQQPAATMTERPYTRTWNERIILKVWPKIENFLIKELSPQYIIDFFMQENILSVDEYEVIFHCMGKRTKMAKKFLETIQQKLPRAFFVLVYALEEIGKTEENGIVKQLERIISDESNFVNVPESDLEEEMTIAVKNKKVPEDACTVKAPLSRDGHYTLKLSLKRAGQTVHATELEINTFINTADDAIKLQVALKPTDCKIIKSELGCVIVHLWPQSTDAYQKLSEFCKKGEMEKLVLDLLREKDIVPSVPAGELCIDLKVNYHEEEQEFEEAGEPQTDLIQLIKDNRSFLREESEVQTLIGEVLENKTLKKMFKDQEITELKRFLAKDKLEAADYFLKWLLNTDPKRRQSCIDTLKGKTKTKIFEKLLKSGSMYRNSSAIKENILHHYELVVDEIDPSQFEDTFIDREILDKIFFENLREKQLRRRARASRFLKEVLDKGGRALFALVDVLREMGCEELVEKLNSFDDKSLKPKQQRKVRVCNDDRKTYANIKVCNATTPEVLMWSCCMTVIVEKKQKGNSQAIKENILHHYELVVDEIDPSQFEDTFMDREILDKKFFENLGEKKLRRWARAASFLKEVLEKIFSFDEKSLKQKQQRKVRVCNDDRKTYANIKVCNATTPEVLMWPCCMTVIVEKKQKGNSQAIKENILHHYELVVDEIDPSQFEDTFMDREILDKKFFENLGEKKLRRWARAASFLKEVLEKITSFDEKSLKPKQQRKVRECNDDRKTYANIKVCNATTPEVLMWPCCMTVIVEKKQKDDKNADMSTF